MSSSCKGLDQSPTHLVTEHSRTHSSHEGMRLKTRCCFFLTVAAWSPPMEEIPPLTGWVLSIDCTPQIAPAWVLSTGWSPLGIDCSDDPHRAVGFYFTGDLLQLASGHINLLQHWVLHGLQVKICSTLALHGLQGHSCLTTAVTSMQRNLCFSSWGDFSLSFFTDHRVF